MKGTGRTGRSLLSLSNRWPYFCGIFLNFAWAEFFLCQAFTIKLHQCSKRNYSRTIACKTVLNDMLLGKRQSQRIPDYAGISAFRQEQIRSVMIQQRKWCWKVIVKHVLFLGSTKHVCMATWSKGLKCKKNNTLQQVQGGLFNGLYYIKWMTQWTPARHQIANKLNSVKLLTQRCKYVTQRFLTLKG